MTSMPPLSTLDSLPVAVQSLRFIPDSREELTNELTRLAGHINAAQYRFLKLLAALIDRNAWGGGNGIRTPAHWLNYYCGIAMGAAREKVRVAKALAHLPLIDQAFASGAISYSKVRAMTRSATPANEATLLNVAKYGTAQHVEKLVRQHRRVKRLNGGKGKQDETQHQARELRYYYDEDGMLLIKGRFAPEEGAVIVKALEAAMDTIEQEKWHCEDQPEGPKQAADVSAETSKQRKSEKTFQRKRESAPGAAHAWTGAPGVSAETSEQEDPQPTFPQKRADALARLAEHFLASGQHSPHSLSNGDKYQVFVHFDARANSELRQIGAPAHLDDGPPLPDNTFRRLACDASRVPVARDDSGNVLNIGRKSRTVPPAIRRALKIRDGGCRYPGCCQTKYVDAHHIQHWCDGGETSLENLVQLCGHHHRLLHEGEFSIEKDNIRGSTLRFMDRHQKEIKPALYPQFEVPPTQDDGKLTIERDNERLGLAITARTAVTRWQGERMDYGLAIDALMRAS